MDRKSIALVILVAAAVAALVSILLHAPSTRYAGHDQLCAKFDAEIKAALDTPSGAPAYTASQTAGQAADAGCYSTPHK